MILNTLDDCTLTCQDDNLSEHHLDDTAIALEFLHRPKKQHVKGNATSCVL